MGELATVRGIATVTLVSLGVLFFFAGSVGLLRFPDLFTRLHAVTKADNVGLGLIVAGLAVDAESLRAGIELGAVWLLVLASSSTVGHLIARRARGGARGHLANGPGADG